MHRFLSCRLIDDFKFKLYKEQKGLCLVCKKEFEESSLVRRDENLQVHYVVSYKNRKLVGSKFKSRLNKILLHKSCHLKLHSDKGFYDKRYLRTKLSFATAWK